MTIVLIFIMSGIFFLGYLMILRLDKFILHEEAIENNIGRRKMGILIFGCNDAVSEARKNGIQYIELAEPILPQGEDYYSAMLILSDNESENIALCQAAHQYDPDIYIIVKCVNYNMKDVYNELGADRIIMPDESTNMVLAEIWRTLK